MVIHAHVLEDIALSAWPAEAGRTCLGISLIYHAVDVGLMGLNLFVVLPAEQVGDAIPRRQLRGGAFVDPGDFGRLWSYLPLLKTGPGVTIPDFRLRQTVVESREMERQTRRREALVEALRVVSGEVVWLDGFGVERRFEGGVYGSFKTGGGREWRFDSGLVCWDGLSPSHMMWMSQTPQTPSLTFQWADRQSFSVHGLGLEAWLGAIAALVETTDVLDQAPGVWTLGPGCQLDVRTHGSDGHDALLVLDTSGRLVVLRDLLHDEVGLATWRRLRLLLEAWPEQELTLAQDYVSEHLAHWPCNPDAVRLALGPGQEPAGHAWDHFTLARHGLLYESVRTDLQTLHDALERRRDWLALQTLEVSALSAEPLANSERFSQWPCLRGLLALTWRGGGVGDVAALALALNPDAAGLRHLDLSHNHITHDGLNRLLGSPYLNRLESLVLDGNPCASIDEAVLHKAIPSLRRASATARQILECTLLVDDPQHSAAPRAFPFGPGRHTIGHMLAAGRAMKPDPTLWVSPGGRCLLVNQRSNLNPYNPDPQDRIEVDGVALIEHLELRHGASVRIGDQTLRVQMSIRTTP